MNTTLAFPSPTNDADPVDAEEWTLLRKAHALERLLVQSKPSFPLLSSLSLPLIPQRMLNFSISDIRDAPSVTQRRQMLDQRIENMENELSKPKGLLSGSSIEVRRYMNDNVVDLLGHIEPRDASVSPKRSIVRGGESPSKRIRLARELRAPCLRCRILKKKVSLTVLSFFCVKHTKSKSPLRYALSMNGIMYGRGIHADIV